MDTFFPRMQLLLAQVIANAGERIGALLPQIITAIFVVLAGWLIAVIIHQLVLWILNLFAVDKLAAKTPLAGMLKNIGIRRSISEILAFLIFWLVIFFTLVVAADTLNLSQVSRVLGVVTTYIPQVIASVLIVMVGMLLAKFLQMIAMQAFSKLEPGPRKSIGNAVQTVVMVFVFIAAVDQLGFELDYVMNALLSFVSVALLMLGLGVAFGARTAVDNAIACQQIRRQILVGDRVRIGENEGTVKGFTLTNIIMDIAGTETIFPATHFLTQTYTRTPHE